MRSVIAIPILNVLLFLAATPAFPQTKRIERQKAAVLTSLAADSARWNATALQIWQNPELGYLEEKSSARLQEILVHEGFSVQKSVADIPTSFIATFGDDSPVVGILAEFDALPGVSQSAVPFRSEMPGTTAGHACGHHLFGAGSVAAAVAVKNWMVSNGIKGTIKVFGTPAEEGGSGKVYMARAGLFQDVDVVFHWHPDDENDASPQGSLANRSAKFRFRGVASHAAMSPEMGRSALDGVEAMNIMVNMMREHIPQDVRIHYVITEGGKAPNVVPAFAEVFYYVRHKNRKVLEEIWDRVEKCAEGAALGSGTTVESEIIHGNYDVLPNATLARVVYDNLVRVGGVTYDEREKAFATELLQTEGIEKKDVAEAAVIRPFTTGQTGYGSTDVGDVSYMVPTAGLDVACWVPGTSAHSWQAVAAGGMSIGLKGMMVAAKTLSLSMIDIFLDPSLAKKARQELETARGSDFKYKALLGDRKPPLNYRR